MGGGSESALRVKRGAGLLTGGADDANVPDVAGRGSFGRLGFGGLRGVVRLRRKTS